ncbi:similar to novel protein (predicted), isoform CRA_c [Rattus norvegicus]|uniref:Similar to novel protein (Predicted), isoform CRA_c n=1 Tax=Rattus norvegicus TaxID=10116 RepID=A6HF06_RAT|nr:similar to novel protein (predicted), isoform CRA_c [Rattus norvegicus]
MYVGITNLEVANKHTQWFEINQVIIHPTFEMFHPVGGDVALVQSKSAIVFSDYVLPICLPSSNLNLSDLSCWTTGWGMVSPQGETGKDLLEAQLPLIPKFQCQLLYGLTSYLLPEMLCAGDIKNMKNVCERGVYVAGRGWTPILHPRGIPELVGHRKPLFLFRVTLAVHWCVR